MKAPVLKQGSVPPRTDLRGLMLDAARLVESADHYRRFLDFCAEWDVNAVIFRLTDDQGCALRFRSHPELVMHPNALTHEEAQAMASYAAARGIELIPEIESLGHSHFIIRSPEHADLDDQAPGGHSWANAQLATWGFGPEDWLHGRFLAAARFLREFA